MKQRAAERLRKKLNTHDIRTFLDSSAAAEGDEKRKGGEGGARKRPAVSDSIVIDEGRDEEFKRAGSPSAAKRDGKEKAAKRGRPAGGGKKKAAEAMDGGALKPAATKRPRVSPTVNLEEEDAAGAAEPAAVVESGGQRATSPAWQKLQRLLVCPVPAATPSSATGKISSPPASTALVVSPASAKLRRILQQKTMAESQNSVGQPNIEVIVLDD